MRRMHLSAFKTTESAGRCEAIRHVDSDRCLPGQLRTFCLRRCSAIPNLLLNSEITYTLEDAEGALSCCVGNAVPNSTHCRFLRSAQAIALFVKYQVEHYECLGHLAVTASITDR